MIKQIIENGECQHILRSKGHVVWCTKDECFFCGNGSEWS